MCLALLTGIAAGCKDDPCTAHVSKIESCDRVFRRDMCAEADDRCAVACYAKLSCEQFDQVDQEDVPPSLQRCLTKCFERFTCDDGTDIRGHYVCDASEDCEGGADERGCGYHRCANGQPVRSDAPCDGYAHCADASDEEGCEGEL